METRKRKSRLGVCRFLGFSRFSTFPSIQKKKRKKKSNNYNKPTSSSSAAETIGNNMEELLIEILARVPARCMVRFKCVSKRWLSLISSREFCHRHTHLQNPNVSAFFYDAIFPETYKCSPLIGSSSYKRWIPFKTLKTKLGFPKQAFFVEILQSCNGLLLLEAAGSFSPHEGEVGDAVYVFNPTTNQLLGLTSPIGRARARDKSSSREFARYGLAFEPRKSPHYQVVCVREIANQVEIYSSETQSWRLVMTQTTSCFDEYISDDESLDAWKCMRNTREGGVYCNGTIHWIRDSYCRTVYVDYNRWMRKDHDLLHYYDIGEQRLGLAVSPLRPVSSRRRHPPPWVLPSLEYEQPEIDQRYFGESSGGRLYLIDILSDCKTQFDVMEMGRDYSAGWFVKYHVDLNSILDLRYYYYYNSHFDVLFLGCENLDDKKQEEHDEKTLATSSSSDLMLLIPRKKKKKNPKTSEISFELANSTPLLVLENSFPFIESLACV